MQTTTPSIVIARYLKGNSTFLEIIFCRDTNHWKKVFYLDLFGPGPVWISIHGHMNVSLYVYLNRPFATVGHVTCFSRTH